jgi:hypothetical protein
VRAGDEEDDFGQGCLLARQLSEARARYIEVTTDVVDKQPVNATRGGKGNPLSALVA